MDENKNTGEPRPLSTASDVGDDPDEGQVIGPHGEAPVAPEAKSFYRGCPIGLLGGCLIGLVAVGIVVGVSWLFYQLFIAT